MAKVHVNKKFIHVNRRLGEPCGIYIWAETWQLQILELQWNASQLRPQINCMTLYRLQWIRWQQACLLSEISLAMAQVFAPKSM